MNREEIIKKIEKIEKKFGDVDKKIEALIGTCKNKKEFLKEFDFYKALDLTIDDVNLLLDYNDLIDLKESEIKRLMKLNDILEKQYKWIDKINEAIILENPSNYKIVNRNILSYFQNKNKNKQDKQNVVINVYVDKSKEDINLEKIGVEKNNND